MEVRKNPAELKRLRESEAMSKQLQNRMEIEKFYMELYKIDDWETLFNGLGVQDIRKEGSTLEDIYPDFLFGKPNTEKYMEQQNNFIELFSRVNKKAEEINAESEAKLCS